MAEQVSEKKNANPMQKISIEKVVLSVGGIGEELDKGVTLLKMVIPDRNPARMKSRKRIPTLSVRPGLEIGAVVTIRKDVMKLLDRLLKGIDNQLKKKQVADAHFSFGIKEYIEIPGMEYNRDIGNRGFDVTVVFRRNGRRVRLKKISRGKIPARQTITKDEIIQFMEENFKTTFS